MKFILTILLLNTLLFSDTLKNRATILLYHHISNNTPKSTSISPEVFEQHLKYLKENNYKVWDIYKIIDHLSKKKKIPEKLVAITFDDAYKSVYTNAFPLLKKYNYPFTIYINSSPIGKKPIYLTWEELNTMKNSELASFGSHSHYHNFLIRKDIKNWAETTFNDLKKSNEIIFQKLSVDVESFAYPFGEYDYELKNIVKSLYNFALGQQSGSIDYNYNPYEIPRFSMTSDFGNINRFKSILLVRPLDMKLQGLHDKVFKENELQNKIFTFSINLNEDYNLNDLNCFDSSGEIIATEKNLEKNKISMYAPKWQMGRHKINCTTISKSNPKIYYWYSEIFYIKSKDNKWYKP